MSTGLDRAAFTEPSGARSTSARALWLAAAIGALAAWVGLRVLSVGDAPRATASAVSEGRIVVLRTPGGLLEVSTIQAPGEVFESRDPAFFGPLDLGTNRSYVRVAATYRYHIPLAPSWRVVETPGVTTGSGAIGEPGFTVIAPKVDPSLPVAYDSATLRRRAEAGWLRFDKGASLDVLERGISAALAQRATSPGAIEQQRETARQTVREFVAKWIFADGRYGRVTPARIRVVFADEPIEGLGGAALVYAKP